jgi:hypothetical protein
MGISTKIVTGNFFLKETRRTVIIAPTWDSLALLLQGFPPIETRGNEKDDWWDRLCPTLCDIFKP